MINALEDESWVMGFLSGVGFEAHQEAQGVDNPLDGMDVEGVWAWIDNYCQTHPINDIAQAAAAFYRAHPHR
jgi:hypothetical protein